MDANIVIILGFCVNLSSDLNDFMNIEPILHKKTFRVRHRNMPKDSMKAWDSDNHPIPSCSTAFLTLK